jgi:hypothetical protein
LKIRNFGSFVRESPERNVTGLGTLISGAYIGIQIGGSKREKSDFIALETPAIVTGDVPGRFLVLKTRDLGSLDVGRRFSSGDCRLARSLPMHSTRTANASL